jgi:hypothetical protein
MTLSFLYSRQYAPIWQQYPFLSGTFPLYNWDWYSEPDFIEPMKTYVNEQRMAVVGPAYINPNP